MKNWHGRSLADGGKFPIETLVGITKFVFHRLSPRNFPLCISELRNRSVVRMFISLLIPTSHPPVMSTATRRTADLLEGCIPVSSMFVIVFWPTQPPKLRTSQFTSSVSLSTPAVTAPAHTLTGHAKSSPSQGSSDLPEQIIAPDWHRFCHPQFTPQIAPRFNASPPSLMLEWVRLVCFPPSDHQMAKTPLGKKPESPMRCFEAERTIPMAALVSFLVS